MRLLTVLRRSCEYDLDYVKQIAFALDRHGLGVGFACLSDCPLHGYADRIPLEYDWPGWWAKMELFRPDIKGDFLYIDLDTLITGPLDSFFSLKRSALLSDFNRPALAQSGVMYLTEDDRAIVWDRFARAGVNATMRKYRGDGEFIRDALPDANRLQDVVPGAIVSYKVDKVKERGVQGASLVRFHGKPRPRDVGWRL